MRGTNEPASTIREASEALRIAARQGSQLDEDDMGVLLVALAHACLAGDRPSLRQAVESLGELASLGGLAADWHGRIWAANVLAAAALLLSQGGFPRCP